jgi:CRISPR-associated protein Cmr5
MPTTINNLQNQRADFAYEKAEEAKNYHQATKVDVAYKNYTKKVLTMIKNNGLSASLAFIKAKAKDSSEKPAYAYHQLYQHLTEWFENRSVTLLPNLSNSDLVREIVKLESTKYRAITIETLSLLVWLKRATEGVIKREEEVSEDE